MYAWPFPCDVCWSPKILLTCVSGYVKESPLHIHPTEFFWLWHISGGIVLPSPCFTQNSCVWVAAVQCVLYTPHVLFPESSQTGSGTDISLTEVGRSPPLGSHSPACSLSSSVLSFPHHVFPPVVFTMVLHQGILEIHFRTCWAVLPADWTPGLFGYATPCLYSSSA